MKKDRKRKRTELRCKDIERLVRAIAWLLIAIAIVAGALMGTGPA
jgi:hypothetical protein